MGKTPKLGLQRFLKTICANSGSPNNSHEINITEAFYVSKKSYIVILDLICPCGVKYINKCNKNHVIQNPTIPRHDSKMEN